METGYEIGKLAVSQKPARLPHCNPVAEALILFLPAIELLGDAQWIKIDIDQLVPGCTRHGAITADGLLFDLTDNASFFIGFERRAVPWRQVRFDRTLGKNPATASARGNEKNGHPAANKSVGQSPHLPDGGGRWLPGRPNVEQTSQHDLIRTSCPEEMPIPRQKTEGSGEPLEIPRLVACEQTPQARTPAGRAASECVLFAIVGPWL